MEKTVRLVLFTRSNCSLCDTAKLVINNVRKQDPTLTYAEIDVMSQGHGRWKGLYEFDTPVVRILHSFRLPVDEEQLHIQPSSQPIEIGLNPKLIPLLHRFSEEQVNDKISMVKKLLQ